jgi:predicted permease
MGNLAQDIKLGFKLLWKDRGFATTAILTLAVCIGANTAIFTIVNSVLLRPLPVPEASNIVIMSNQYPNAGSPDSNNSGVPDYFDRLQAVTAFEEQALYNVSGGGTIDINGAPERVHGMAATPSLFRLLRSAPEIGRAFADSEGEIGNDQKVILSYGLWQQLYGGDRSVLGRELRINGRPNTIIGVMPRNFQFADPDVRLWKPLTFTAEQKSDASRHDNSWTNVGRLKRGATIEQAQAQVNALNAANLDRFPKYKELLINAGFHTRVDRLQDMLVRHVKDTLYLLWGGAAFVLLIGGVNIANLVLARSALRRKELVTRLTLGATKLQVARHLMFESLLLALTGGAGGILVGALALRALTRIGLDRIPRAAEIHMDAAVVIFTFAVTVIVGLLIGLVPVADLSAVKLATVLREEGRTGTSGRKSRAIRRVLVAAQVAFAFMLLIGAGLLLASFRQLLTVDPGFRPDGVVTASFVLPGPRYAGASEMGRFADRALDGLRSIPGVTNAGLTTIIPLGHEHSDSVIVAEGYVMKPGESLVSPMRVRVTPGYFETIGATLIRGRYFNEHDNETAPGVVIVDERLARKFWPNSDPIGRRMYRPSNPDDLFKIDEHTRWLTVAGVVREIRMDDLTGNTTMGAYYFPFAQDVSGYATFAVKSNGDATALITGMRTEIAKVDPELALFDIHTMTDLRDLSLMSRRAAMLLAIVFGGVALFLSVVGIYGVLAYLVTQRKREIGIRIALGSSAGGIFKLVLREGVSLVVVGILLGFAGAAALRTFLESQVYGVRPMDPWVISIVALGLAAIALAACALPARRATQIDPVRVLNA